MQTLLKIVGVVIAAIAFVGAAIATVLLATVLYLSFVGYESIKEQGIKGTLISIWCGSDVKCRSKTDLER